MLGDVSSTQSVCQNSPQRLLFPACCRPLGHPASGKVGSTAAAGRTLVPAPRVALGIPAVCRGVLPILLSVFQAAGQTVSKYWRTEGSPSRLAMWKLFHPSLFFRSGLAPCSTRSWITSRFLLVQAIIRGVLRSNRTSCQIKEH